MSSELVARSTAALAEAGRGLAFLMRLAEHVAAAETVFQHGDVNLVGSQKRYVRLLHAVSDEDRLDRLAGRLADRGGRLTVDAERALAPDVRDRAARIRGKNLAVR